jgi:hypothetical protein
LLSALLRKVQPSARAAVPPRVVFPADPEPSLRPL